MNLSKDKKSLIVNDSLTLDGIPPEVFDYRLGNRSALDWVIDQYQVNTDKRSGITSDPNRPDEPEYLVRLVGQVVRVGVETVQIVNALPKDYGGSPSIGGLHSQESPGFRHAWRSSRRCRAGWSRLPSLPDRT